MLISYWRLLAMVLLFTCNCQAHDDIQNCVCTERNLCVLPFYQINETSTCAEPDHACCTRVEYNDVKCGQDTELRRISSGHDTNPSEVPWTTAIIHTSNPERQLMGSGSLIHPGVVLTAAHIVEGVPLNEIEVRVGAFDLNPSTPEHFSERRELEGVIKHPLFNSQHLTNDLALLILKSPVTLNGKIKTLCLPEQAHNFDANSCVFASWGNDPSRTESEEAQSQLKKADLYIIPRRQCQEDLRRSKHFASWLHLHSGFLCTIGETPTQRPCKGDGGSPLFCWREDGAFYEQAGVASWGAECTDSDATPAVFTNVAKFRDWIDDVLGRLSDGIQNHKL